MEDNRDNDNGQIPIHRKGSANYYENLVETMLYTCRWLLLPLFLGLSFLVILLIYEFYSVLFHTAINIGEIHKKELIVVVLTLVDMCLIGGLVVMVAISGYENFVSRITLKDDDEKPTIFSRLDPGTIKVKLGMVIIVIASIQLLQTLMDIKNYTNDQVLAQIEIHICLILAGAAIGFIDSFLTKKHGTSRENRENRENRESRDRQ
ncbi:MAG: YqhA family protein [Alphaproteobacteria bacterium]